MSGSVEVGELVPVIFNKASTPQHHLIRHLIEYENAMVSDKNTSRPRGVPDACRVVWIITLALPLEPW